MSIEGALGAVGLAQKAGKCISGTDSVERVIQNGAAKLLLIDENISRRTRDDWLRRAERAGIETVELNGLGSSIGRPGRMIAAITDERFARMITDKFRDLRDDGTDNHGGVE